LNHKRFKKNESYENFNDYIGCIAFFSASINTRSVPPESQMALNDTAIFAGGCFWGVEYYMQKAPGVISTEVGYIGGSIDNPSYEKVSNHKTGHAEAVRVVFDSEKTKYENIAKLFFEIHNPTQVNRQGPDIGDQYRSSVFYLNEDQKRIAEKLVGILTNKGYKVATLIVRADKFRKSEEYHQNYYGKGKDNPYCHAYVKRF